MKVVLLAGGAGTRISEESEYWPKPMVEIGGMPILWHIMKYYSSYGYNDFVICGGYKQHCIKEYFSNYFINHSDITFNMRDNSLQVHNNNSEQWKVTVVDTGLYTNTGGRLNKIKKYVADEPFMLTYGDGVSDINIRELIKYHKNKGKTVTISAVTPGGRFGSLDIDDYGIVNSFVEKRREDGGWINGGYMVIDPEIFDYIDDNSILEREPFEELTKKGQLVAYKHYGFWQCMDSMKDHSYLESLITANKAPWIRW